MSMLLEALKKSEEQRQLGSRPDIHRSTDHNPDGKPASKMPWLPLVLAFAAVSVMTWLGWNQFRMPAGMEAVPAADQAVESGQQAEPDATTTPAAAVPRPPRTMVEQFARDKSQAAAGTEAESQPEEQRRQDVSRSFNQFAAKPETQKPASKQKPAPGSTSSPKTVVSAAQAEPNPPAVANRTPPQSVESRQYEAEIMSYWALPQGVRDNLPEFRITVLVFADKPEDRFLLINGMRLKESEELQSGVLLDEIRREGAVFRARNYRFLVRGG